MYESNNDGVMVMSGGEPYGYVVDVVSVVLLACISVFVSCGIAVGFIFGAGALEYVFCGGVTFDFGSIGCTEAFGVYCLYKVL